MNTHLIKTASSDLDFSGKKVLIVDDFHEMRTVLRNILCNCGTDSKNIYTADSGNAAIALLKETKFDIVLCDLVLKSGKNGQQVLEQAKYQSLIDASCLWIMISAEKTMEAVSGAAEHKPDAYILKPITEENLRTRLLKIWEKKAAFAAIHQAVRQQEYTKAIRLCDNCLVTNKAHTFELLRLKSDLLLFTGEYESVVALSEKILTQRDVPWAKVTLAKALLKKNQTDAANNLLKAAIETNPTFMEAHDLLAQTLQAHGNYEEAFSVLEHAIGLSPNSVIRQKTLGDTAMKIGKAPDAERAYRKSIQLGEHSVYKTADAYLGLAKACVANMNHDEALKTIDQLEKDFSIAEALQLKTLLIRGIVYHQNGETEKVQQIGEKLCQIIDTENSHLESNDSLEIARLLLASGNSDKAIELLQSEIKSNPDNAALLHTVTEIFNQANMGEKGHQLIETTRREAMLIMNRGVLLISKGQYNEAIAAMRAATKAMPSNARVLLNQAHVIIAYIQKNGVTAELIAEARDSLAAANQLAPGEPRHARLISALHQLTTAA
ncbi:MAG: tetratricopeptide repeat protein [Nitrosomonas sp.]|nr:MAG: tetratricopeptide repeat protein [Nitrosomonas sp.]